MAVVDDPRNRPHPSPPPVPPPAVKPQASAPAPAPSTLHGSAAANAAVPATTAATAASAGLAPWVAQALQDFPSWGPFFKIPEVASVLQQAVALGWNSDEFKTHLESTRWWQSTNDVQRNWYLLQVTDPATARRQLAEQAVEVHNQITKWGIQMDPLHEFALASQILDNGWSQTEIDSQLGRMAISQGKPLTGDLGAERNNLKAMADQYLVPVSDHALDYWAVDVKAGSRTEDAWRQYLTGVAKSRYTDPGIQHALDEGLTVEQFADPYKQMASTALGVAPTGINFMDPRWSRALEYTDDKGNRRAMTLDEWNTQIKTNSIYGYDNTTNGMKDAATIANQIQQEFGVA